MINEMSDKQVLLEIRREYRRGKVSKTLTLETLAKKIGITLNRLHSAIAYGVASRDTMAAFRAYLCNENQRCACGAR